MSNTGGVGSPLWQGQVRTDGAYIHFLIWSIPSQLEFAFVAGFKLIPVEPIFPKRETVKTL